MNKYLIILFLLSCTAVKEQEDRRPLLGARSKINCGGVERWGVKTLQDEAGTNEINFTPKTITVKELTEIATLQVGTFTPRLPQEKQLYSITCIVQDFFKETDGDIHIIIRDLESTVTCIAEVPNHRCNRVSNSKYSPQFRQVRRYLSSVRRKIRGKKVLLTGIAFIDMRHSMAKRGVAPNDIEIHPILTLKIL